MIPMKFCVSREIWYVMRMKHSCLNHLSAFNEKKAWCNRKPFMQQVIANIKYPRKITTVVWLIMWSPLMKSADYCPQICFSVFHRFRQAKFAYSGLILSTSHFLILSHHPPLKMKLAFKVVKIDSKIITSLPWSKSVKDTIETLTTKESAL
jgi:hypothetical protein